MSKTFQSSQFDLRQPGLLRTLNILHVSNINLIHQRLEGYIIQRPEDALRKGEKEGALTRIRLISVHHQCVIFTALQSCTIRFILIKSFSFLQLFEHNQLRYPEI